MINPDNRELMAELYRIMEKHEVPPADREKCPDYFEAVLTDVQAYYRKWWQEKQNPFAHRLAYALYAALADQCRDDN